MIFLVRSVTEEKDTIDVDVEIQNGASARMIVTIQLFSKGADMLGNRRQVRGDPISLKASELYKGKLIFPKASPLFPPLEEPYTLDIAAGRRQSIRVDLGK
jgi:hypothetical protein